AATKAGREAVRLDPDDPAVGAARSALAAKPATGPEAERGVAEEPEEEAPEETPERPDALEPVPPSFAAAWREAVEEDEEKPPEDAAEVSADFKSFVESVEPEKEDVLVLLQLAELALEGGDAEMALLRYQQAIEREPRSPEAWTGKGTALQQLERYKEALEAYDRALELAPDHELATRWRETCLRHLKKEGRM
ncbi:MAG: tetratricopeptide repeat protein, partial [Candidatus Thermoplasmatota archaeon]